MLNDRDIICLSSLPYHGRPTSRHHLVRELAGAGNRVLFVDPWLSAVRRARLHRGRLHQEDPAVTRLEPPPHLPWRNDLSFRMFTAANQRRYAAGVARAAARVMADRPILWNCFPVYPSPRVAPRVRPRVHFLHLTDSIWDFPQYRPEYERYLRQILDQAHFAVGATPEIAERLAGYGIPSRHLPHGVDAEHFAPVARAELVPPDRLAQLPRPRVGFVGRLDRRLDVDAIKALAGAPGSTILVGPQRHRWADLSALEGSGCVILPEVPYDRVPEVMAAFDIAIMPYRDLPSVRASRPLKILEYLAAGLPVVATDIPATRELGDLVWRVESGPELAAAVAALWERRETEIDDRTARCARLESVREFSWRARAEDLSAWVETTLESDG